MAYFEDRIENMAKNIEYAFSIDNTESDTIPILYRLAKELNNNLKNNPQIRDNLFVHYVRAKDGRSILGLRIPKTDEHILLKHCPYALVSKGHPTVSIIELRGQLSKLLLSLIARDIHRIFRELDDYFAHQKPVHTICTIDVKSLNSKVKSGEFVSEVTEQKKSKNLEPIVHN